MCVLLFLEYLYRSGIARSPGCLVFNFSWHCPRGFLKDLGQWHLHQHECLNVAVAPVIPNIWFYHSHECMVVYLEVLILISLMITNIEHLLTYCFSYQFVSPFYILNTSLLLVIYCELFSQSVVWLFTLLLIALLIFLSVSLCKSFIQHLLFLYLIV